MDNCCKKRNKVNSVITLYLHVGHRKTATSWMQDILFSKMGDINYIGKTTDSYPDWLIEWHYLDDFAFEQKEPYIIDQLHKAICKNRINVISSEAFTNTGVIFSQAHRIKRIVPKAKIILTLRDPISVVRSHYIADIKEGLFLDLDACLDWGRTPFVIGKRNSIYLPDFFFGETISLYNDLFANENVCVLKYEDLLTNFNAFFGKLSSFMKITFDREQIEESLKVRINKSVDTKEIAVCRNRNLRVFLSRHFPALASEILPVDILADVSNKIISQRLESELVEYFKGKTAGYY